MNGIPCGRVWIEEFDRQRLLPKPRKPETTAQPVDRQPGHAGQCRKRRACSGIETRGAGAGSAPCGEGGIKRGGEEGSGCGRREEQRADGIGEEGAATAEGGGCGQGGFHGLE